MAFTLTFDRKAAKIGSTIQLFAATGTFPVSKSMVVYIGGIAAREIYHSNNTSTVIIPVGVDSGEQTVKVFDRITGITIAGSYAVDTNIHTINITYADIKFDDTSIQSTTSRFVPTSIGTISVYSRDLGYTNYTEITDATSVVQNVLSIILTRRGERIFNPGFGTTVQDMLFSTVASKELMEKNLINEIKTQVEIYEKRAKIIFDRSFVEFDEEHNALFIVVYIEVPGGSVKELGITLSSVTKDTIS